MRETKKIIKLIPFCMLGICFALSLCYQTEWYSKAYPYLSQLIGFSIITNIYFLYFVVRNNMCTYTGISVYGLIALNIADIVNIFFPFREFYSFYTGIISGTFLLIAIIYSRCKIK